MFAASAALVRATLVDDAPDLSLLLFLLSLALFALATGIGFSLQAQWLNGREHGPRRRRRG